MTALFHKSDTMPSMKELLAIRDAITGTFEIVSVEGGFLFIKNKEGKAVEVSVNENNWWIEFWDANDDAHADSVRQVDAATLAEVLDEVNAWFKE